MRQSFSLLMRRAGLPDYTPPVLRHTFAVELLKDGAPPTLVQSLPGYASITMTCDTYGRWMPSDDRTWIDRLGARMQMPAAVTERLAAGSEPRRAVVPASHGRITRPEVETPSLEKRGTSGESHADHLEIQI